MQLGTRWTVGGAPPAGLADDVIAAIRQVEANVAQFDTAAWRWTLTWLEGRPVIDLDDGTEIRVGFDGSVTVTEPEA